MKKPERKPQKRRAAKPVRDDDLATLAEVINEHTLENNARGWFVLPWHSGWNAAALAYEAWIVVSHEAGSIVIDEQLERRIKLMIQFGDETTRVYEDANELLDLASDLVAMAGCDDVRFLTAALRCIQIQISNSSGGGTAYNGVLLRPFERVSRSDLFAAAVMRNRCRDAIGVSAVFAQDSNDRLRRAFQIAWSRGLYRAAYALPRAA